MTESDALPFRILREIYRHPSLRIGGRESYAQLASGLGVDDNTVRASLERMRRSGFLKAWSVSLNPHALDMECKSMLVKLDQASLKQIARIKKTLGPRLNWCLRSAVCKSRAQSGTSLSHNATSD
jgi:DNA-binding Lrp family transcriptional regulator